MAEFLKQVRINLDLGKNQIKNLVIDKEDYAPSSPVVGQIYFDTQLKKYGVYLGSGEGKGWKYFATTAELEAGLAQKQDNLTFESNSPLSLDETDSSLLKIATSTSIADAGTASNSKVATEAAVRAGLDAVAEAAQTATKIDGETIQRKGAEAGEHAGELYVRKATDALTGVVELATVDEAKAGTDSERAVTPAGAKALVGQDIEAFRTAAVVLEGKTIAADTNTISGLAASNFADGKVALGAAEAEGQAETLAEAKLISEKLVDQKIAAATPYATTDVAGIVKLATSEMAIAGTDEAAAVTSKALHDAIAKNIVGAVTYIGALSGVGYPVQKGDLFLVDVDTTFAGVDLKKGDYILFNKEVADAGSLAETSFDVIDNSESDDLVRKDAAQTLTNKTIDASNNTISNLSMTNLSAANAEFATKETTDELKSAAKVASLAKVEELIASAKEAAMAVDGVTIGHTAEGKLEVKDNGLTVAKMNSEAVSTAIAKDAASDTKLATEKAVRDLHDGIPAEAMVLTNKTFDANATGNALSNVELADMAAGVVQTTLRASERASDTAVATEKAVSTALEKLDDAAIAIKSVDLTFIAGEGTSSCTVSLSDAGFKSGHTVSSAKVIDESGNEVECLISYTSLEGAHAIVFQINGAAPSGWKAIIVA